MTNMATKQAMVIAPAIAITTRLPMSGPPQSGNGPCAARAHFFALTAATFFAVTVGAEFPRELRSWSMTSAIWASSTCRTAPSSKAAHT
jgi:hypothetical protein